MPTTWDKSPAEHVASFDKALPASAKVERRKMFSYPCAFVNGNMFAGLHERNICARVGEATAKDLIASGKAAAFAPMAGRVMREYVAVPAAHCADAALLEPWLAAAFEYTSKLPPKAPKPKPPLEVAARRSASAKSAK
jgi:TfoX/Sxy family transcriptional regulator of competence genes